MKHVFHSPPEIDARALTGKGSSMTDAASAAASGEIFTHKQVLSRPPVFWVVKPHAQLILMHPNNFRRKQF